MKTRAEKLSKIRYLLPVLGTLFLLWYIKNASADIVSTDYIRLVNSYLPDYLNPEKFFVKDILTRIPISFPLRAWNVLFFGFSVHFDRILGALGLGFSALTLARYTERMRLPLLFSGLPLLLMFSLNKWEMLLNGSGYAHFLAFFLFYLHFLCIEPWMQGTASSGQRKLLWLLPLLALLTAGPYLLVYGVCLLFAYGFLAVSGNRNVKKQDCLLYAAEAGLMLFLYFLSNHFAVYEYAGAKDIGIMETLKRYPAFSLHFLLNGLSSMLLSGELLEELLAKGILTMPRIYLLGGMVGFGYVLAGFLYLSGKMYQKTLFPALLLLYGMGSHAAVFLSRYIFLRETYAWQSRYSLQYQSGILGMILIFALYWRNTKEKSRKEKQSSGGRQQKRGVLIAHGISLSMLTKVLISLLSVAFLLGNCYTSYAEIKKMPYREIRYEEMRKAAENISEYTDEALENIFEYHHGGERIRRAYRILEENKLSIFREKA